MDFFWIIAAFPLIWPFVAKVFLKDTLNWFEVSCNVGLCVLIVAGIWFGGRYSAASDVEVWNGEVTNKQRTRVSCEHSYECNCRNQYYTDSNGKRQSRRVCDTCYEHSHDYDWDVFSNVGNFEISRIDRQGRREPPRWSKIKIGEPVAREHDYTNWVKAAPQSLFNDNSEIDQQYKDDVPDYPRVYDYHHIDRVIPINVNIENLDQWNKDLAEILKVLGPQKQANAQIIISNHQNPNFFYAVQNGWIGGKKNDITLLIGAPNYPEIEWVNVFSWAKQDIFNSTLRDEILDLKTVDREKVIQTLYQTTMDLYERRPMKEFEYLKNDIDPPLWVIILSLLIAIPGSIGLTVFFHFHEVNPFDKSSRFRR